MKCRHCPLRGSDLPCLVETMGAISHPYCERVDPDHPTHDPRYREVVARLSRGEPPVPPPTPTASTSPLPCPEPRGVSLPLALRIWWADAVQAFRATYLGASPQGCGCGGRA